MKVILEWEFVPFYIVPKITDLTSVGVIEVIAGSHLCLKDQNETHPGTSFISGALSRVCHVNRDV